MIQPKGFIKLLGGEYDLMQKAGGTVLFRFYLASVIILLIAIISFCSVAYAIEILFHAVMVEFFLSTFLSALFVLLFIFIVNTFTKDARQRKLLNLSNVTRLGFVMFIGFIISQPIAAFLYRHNIESDIAAYKEQLVKEHSLKINQLFDQDLAKLSDQKRKFTLLNESGGFEAELSKLDRSLTAIDQKKKVLATTSAIRIEQGAYFIYRIKTIAGKYPGAWIFSLVIVLLFLTPVYLIYSISSDEAYFRRKNAREKMMVETAYKAFGQKYTAIFQAKYKVHLECYSKYEDPPFNTIVKRPPVCKSVEDFHQRYAQP